MEFTLVLRPLICPHCPRTAIPAQNLVIKKLASSLTI
jgi:hypothetical protein